MKIDKSTSKKSVTRILVTVVVVLFTLLVLLIAGLWGFSKLRNETPQLLQQFQGVATNTIEDTQVTMPEETEAVKYDGTVIAVESVTIQKGSDEVTLNIQVHNNPGFMGAILKVSVDDQIFDFKSGTQIGFPGLTLTSPGPAVISSPYIFMMDAMELSDSDRCDGTMFAITFHVKDPSVTGEFDVTLSCEEGGVFDEDFMDLDVILDNGTITIE